jgi:hypothetical protein
MDPKGLMMIGAVLVGGFFALTTLKDVEAHLPGPAAITALSTSPLGRDGQTRAAGVAADYLVERTWGVNAEGPVATHDRSAAVFIGDAIHDWRPADADEVVARVQMLREPTDCKMPAPAAGARVVNLTVEHPSTKSGLYSFTEADLLESVETWYDRIRSSEETPRVPGPASSHEYRVHDIAVTETAAPVHLVLRNLAASNVLYNIHLAPGAVVAGVSMLGGDANAVAGLAPGVPVAVMTLWTLAACGVAMRDALRGAAGIEAKIRDYTLRTEDEIVAARTALAAGVAAHDAWFRAQFGVPSTQARIGLSFAEVSLIGPVPADPSTGAPVYHPLTGANVLAQAQEYFKVEGLHAWPESYREEVTRMGALLAGGDPHQIVRPAYMAKEF